MILDDCDVGDDGVTSMLANLGKDEFKMLEELWLNVNKITDKGCATITAAICQGALPSLRALCMIDNHDISPEARKTLREVRLTMRFVSGWDE